MSKGNFLVIQLDDGTEWTSLSRLTNGMVSCCVCFEFCLPSDLDPVDGEPGKTWDVCIKCARTEALVSHPQKERNS